MKKENNKKINSYSKGLFLLLIVSLLLYLKLYVFADDLKSSSVDLPHSVTNNIWYEYGTLNKLEFNSSNFEYSDKDLDLSKCNKYYYNKNTNMINFNCKNYSMKLVSVSDYKMILVINNKDVVTYYSSLELTKYLMDNNITNISDSDIKSIIEDNDFEISKIDNSDIYKNIQLSKLSSINELSIDSYISLKNSNKKAMVFLINPNMSIDSYDLIPIFMSWKNVYKDYEFYYVNGLNLSINDSYILNKDKVLKEYLVGLYDSNILIFDSGEYKRISVNIVNKDDNHIFDCSNLCSDIDLKIYDNETIYDDLDDVLSK